MTNQDIPFLSELAWDPMGRAVWGTTVALHIDDEDGGLMAAKPQYKSVS
jgi:hypothetical protein